jgi:hypothetical protein
MLTVIAMFAVSTSFSRFVFITTCKWFRQMNAKLSCLLADLLYLRKIGRDSCIIRECIYNF